MAAKINKTVKISLQNGSMGPVGSGKTVPGPGNVLGGGTRMTKGSKPGGAVQSTGPDFGTARGIEKGSGRGGNGGRSGDTGSGSY